MPFVGLLHGECGADADFYFSVFKLGPGSFHKLAQKNSFFFRGLAPQSASDDADIFYVNIAEINGGNIPRKGGDLNPAATVIIGEYPMFFSPLLQIHRNDG